MVMLHSTTLNKVINRIFHYIYSDIFCVKTIEKIKANKKPKQRFCPDSELPK